MRKWFLNLHIRTCQSLCTLVLISSCQLFAQKADYKSIVNRYIIQYREIAVSEMVKSRIPASITLAQGILESNAGQSNLATEANNHFGIKCHKEWTGETLYKDDETKHECFRKYSSAEDSYHDHSQFLVQRVRYKDLFELNITDYKGWARGLKKAGYATNPAYAEKLIQTIETFKLYRLDYGDYGAAFVDSLDHCNNDSSKNPWIVLFKVAGTTSDRHQIYINNGLRLTISRQGDDWKKLSDLFHITTKKLMKYNELTNSHLEPGQIIYLQSKRRKAATPSHKIKAGETLYQISQGYGIKLKMIYKRNALPEGSEPATGKLIRLR